MRARTFAAFFAAAAVTTFITPAHAQSMRCKNDLVSVGDTRASVLLKCGEPVVKDTFCKPVVTQPGAQPAQPAQPAVQGPTVVNVVPCENVDEWTYNPGYGQFMTTLRFETGRLAAIKYGDRVK